MKNVVLVISIVFVIIGSLLGCGLLVEHRMQEDLKRIPAYEVNPTNTKQVLNSGKVYQITNIKVERIQIKSMIGRIRKIIVFNEDYQILQQINISIKNLIKIADKLEDNAAYMVPYLNVYEMEGENSDHKIVIEINGMLYLGVSVEDDISSYPVIEYQRNKK